MVDEFSAFLKALKKHLEFSGSIVLKRKKLHPRTQLPGKTVAEFLTALRHQGAFCVYGTTLEECLWEVFVEGLNSKSVQDHFLCECIGSDVPTLDRAVQLALRFVKLA